MRDGDLVVRQPGAFAVVTRLDQHDPAATGSAHVRADWHRRWLSMPRTPGVCRGQDLLPGMLRARMDRAGRRLPA